MDNLAKDLNSPKNNQTVSPRQSILVIDDSTEALDLQKILLGLAGYSVYTAESGEEALQLLAEISEPHLILLDMQLGDMSGLDFLALLEEREPYIIQHVPVVFLTGMSDIPQSKAVGLIQKPADTDQFLKAVRQFIKMGYHAPSKH